MAKNTSLTPQTKRRFLIWFWGIFCAIAIAIFALFYCISRGWIGYMPPLEELQNPKQKYATVIYSSDMQVLGNFFSNKENRINTTYSELPECLVNALIATEDARFEDHSGIDFRALVRVFVKRILLRQHNAGGGSTISQQLAKLLYSPPADNIIYRALQKPIEWVIAVRLERLYTKQEIITLYLNQFDFLYNAVGIKSAAQVYFGTSPENLKIEQAAMLVGMLKNPALYNPIRRKDRTTERRNVVLAQMEKANYITASECDSLQKLPLSLDYHRVDHKLGLAPYFREYLRIALTAKKPNKDNYASWQKVPYGKYYLDSLAWENDPLYGFCEKNTKADGTKYNIYSDGLKIYTTIDSRMQRYAEEAVKEHFSELQKKFFKEKKGKRNAPFSSDVSKQEIDRIIQQSIKQTQRYRAMKSNHATDKEIETAFNTPVEMEVFSWEGIKDTVMTPIDSIYYHKHFVRCGFMSMDPTNGFVKAYVGGPNYTYFQYDMATMGRRQVGSTIKPYLYTLAMNEGFWPCNTTINQEVTLYDAMGRPYTPRNDSKQHIGEEVTLKWGLQNSNNWISAYLMSLFTPEKLVNLMRSFGLKGQIDPVVSLCLGPCEVTLAEMVDAYTTFPNQGIRIDPIYVTRIEDANNNVIASFSANTQEVIDKQTTYKMLDMLTAVIDAGTGIRLRYRYNLKMPAGGKTGTTQNNSDGWFIGFTPSLVSGVWAGFEDRSINFSSMADGQGANMALPIWALYMDKIYKDEQLGYSQEETFNIPETFNPNAGCE